MRDAESVMFGGSGLDRAAELRRDAVRVAAMLNEGSVLPIWRGKPLLDAETRLPVFLDADHSVFDSAGEPAHFLGIDDDTPRFVRDVSAFEPDANLDSVGQFTDMSEQSHPALGPDQVFADLREKVDFQTLRADFTGIDQYEASRIIVRFTVGIPHFRMIFAISGSSFLNFC